MAPEEEIEYFVKLRFSDIKNDPIYPEAVYYLAGNSFISPGLLWRTASQCSLTGNETFFFFPCKINVLKFVTAHWGTQSQYPPQQDSKCERINSHLPALGPSTKQPRRKQMEGN